MAQWAEAYGVPADVDPVTALVGEVRHSAGTVAWLRTQLAERGHTDDVLLSRYDGERDRLGRLAALAVRAGVDERLVSIEEERAAAMVDVFRAALNDTTWGLSPEQRRAGLRVIAGHLRAELPTGETL
ncbi:MAG: hypothetical protein AAGA93_20775 [Actinomycetota bacterium]